ERPEVTNVFAQIGSTVVAQGPGGGGGGGSDLRSGTVTVLLDEGRDLSGDEIRREELRRLEKQQAKAQRKRGWLP
ncbi:MAG: hypothetical protein KKA97_08790, partial [Actinobacteria bacterium]|nr:hypothetical protein [Actinomycetota bacterium]